MAKGSGNCAWGAGSIMLWKMMTGNVLRSYANFTTVITDSSNPMFDLEALMTKVADGSIQV